METGEIPILTADDMAKVAKIRDMLPGGVMEAAEGAALTTFWTADPQYAAVVDACIVAILAERVRCAKIAESRRSTPSVDIDPYGTTLALRIAEAIRA